MIYRARNHQCATCKYWGGERNINYDPRIVECDSSNKGICMGPDSKLRAKKVECHNRPIGRTCYVRWDVLKE